MKALSYSDLNTPRRRVINALYAAAHSGNPAPSFAGSAVIPLLVSSGWLIYDYGHTAKLTPEAERACKDHWHSKKVTKARRAELSSIQRIAKAAIDKSIISKAHKQRARQQRLRRRRAGGGRRERENRK